MSTYRIVVEMENEIVETEICTNDFEAALITQEELKAQAKESKMARTVSLYLETEQYKTLLESDTFNPTKVIQM